MCLFQGQRDAVKAVGAGRKAKAPLSEGLATWGAGPALALRVHTV